MKGKEVIVKLKISSEKLREFPTELTATTTTPQKTNPQPTPTTATPSVTPQPRGKPGPKPKKSSALSMTMSPAPESPMTMEGTPIPGAIIGKAALSSTKAINGESFKLDKSGKPVRKWVKKPVEIQSFTGYFMQFGSFTGGPRENDGLSAVGVKAEDAEDDGRGPLKIQIKLNNKSLELKDDDSVIGDSREQSPLLDDIASSALSSPEISRVSTPAIP